VKLQKKDLQTLLVIILSAAIYAFNIKTFVQFGGLIPGGFSGISVLSNRLILTYLHINIPFGYFYFSLNVIPTFLVFKYVGKRFTIFSVIQYVLVSIFTLVMPNYAVTGDIMLIAVFGGLLAGVATSLALSVNASGGGTDFIAIYSAYKLKRSTWSYILYGNAILLTIAGLVFSWESALYSIIYQFVTIQVINSRHLRFKHVGLYMITEKPDEMMERIFKSTRHGITKLWGEGGFSKKPKCLLYMVINAFEVETVTQAAKDIDPKVFISITKVEKVIGNYYQKPLE